MTAPPGDLVAYHIGVVVPDLQAVPDRYQRLLGIDHWQMRELATPRVPWDACSTDARLKIAFGRGAGLTFELIQVLEGRTQHLDFLNKHGDGVQHIGFWTPNAVVGRAVKEGGTITMARFDPGLGGVQLEFMGPASAEGLPEWMAADFDIVLAPLPPW